MSRYLSGLFFVACLILPAAQAEAGLITSASSNTWPSKVIDFSQFDSQYFGTGPIQVGTLVSEDVVWTSNYSGAFLGQIQTGYGFAGNGLWGPGRLGFTATDSSKESDSITFTFNSGPVRAVGGIVNYASDTEFGESFFIEALGAGNVVLESYNIKLLAPISTQDEEDKGAFRGIARGSADIFAFRVRGAFGAVDDLTFSSVPEPTSIAYLGVFGLIGLAFKPRRRLIA